MHSFVAIVAVFHTTIFFIGYCAITFSLFLLFQSKFDAIESPLLFCTFFSILHLCMSTQSLENSWKKKFAVKLGKPACIRTSLLAVNIVVNIGLAVTVVFLHMVNFVSFFPVTASSCFISMVFELREQFHENSLNSAVSLFLLQLLLLLGVISSDMCDRWTNDPQLLQKIPGKFPVCG